MKRIFKSFAKKLFGAKYERLAQVLFIYPPVFLGLYIAGFRIRISPSVLYLLAGTFTAGVMWQALSSEDNAANMQNMLMLPFHRRKFVFSYIAALGTYALLTKTAALLTVLFAVSNVSFGEALGSILSAVSAVLIAAGAFSVKKYWYVGGLWAAVWTAVILLLGNSAWFAPAAAANSIFALLLLQKADGYCYLYTRKNSHTLKHYKKYSVWRYLFRYLKTHKNYMLNTTVMWCVACVLPKFLGQMESRSAIPLGLAVLCMNTPICILLSCDPALEQAVRVLPCQKKAFCVPYCLFIFLCNMAACGIFLISLQIQFGNVTGSMPAEAVFIALQSAVLSVLLEWFYPVRGWKIESDLWHHPRKYLVPSVMLLLAGVIAAVPGVLVFLIAMLLGECAVLLVYSYTTTFMQI